ncbi:mediator of RNA polymerase II transcription subunit 15a-like isoform X2 [Prosopis cineraria]|uniref:mediator of RNA polymerase II transcription subunit 15a-like isoform X2 n=1 Tax=Prosopis cineraria TaxID=364024 RepID=UPI0024105935|nr:mediator of RNA polymerase II transcription subunit 15a-like isoform X2 [Prosopis cineraria]
MDTHDWRAQLLPHIRRSKVNEIMSILKLYQSHGDDDGLLEVLKSAQCFEQKTYAGAASREDYLQKISSMLQLMSEKYWRAGLQPDSRRRIINKILETLRRHLPVSGQEGLDELRKIAARFEEKIYNAATGQADYLRRISLKMLTMENRGQNTIANSMRSNLGDNGDGPSDTGSVTVRRAQVLGGQVAPSEGERNASGRQSIRKRKRPQWLADFVTNL